MPWGGVGEARITGPVIQNELTSTDHFPKCPWFQNINADTPLREALEMRKLAGFLNLTESNWTGWWRRSKACSNWTESQGDLASSGLLEIGQPNQAKQKQTESKYGQVIECTWQCSSQSVFVPQGAVSRSSKAHAPWQIQNVPLSNPKTETLVSTEGQRAKSPFLSWYPPSSLPSYPSTSPHLNNFVSSLVSKRRGSPLWNSTCP